MHPVSPGYEMARPETERGDDEDRSLTMQPAISFAFLQEEGCAKPDSGPRRWSGYCVARRVRLSDRHLKGKNGSERGI